jgi:hypothetical protein
MHDSAITDQKTPLLKQESNNMKKFIFSTILATIVTLVSTAQEYKLAKSTGKLIINLPSATIEGYNGNEIIITSGKSLSETEDDRSKGLRRITGSGLVDNTGLGVNVTEKGSNIEVSPVGNQHESLVIKVPKGVTIYYSFSKVMNNGTVTLKNLESEVEVSVQYNKIKLDNVTGPMAIKTLYGNIDAKLGNNVKGPVSLVSIYGYVDVSIPGETKANLSLNTTWGEILASSDLKIDVEKSGSGDMVSYSENKVKGKLNGGGLDLTATSTYGKVYLRKN